MVMTQILILATDGCVASEYVSIWCATDGALPPLSLRQFMGKWSQTRTLLGIGRE
jgi:hypothetical protein